MGSSWDPRSGLTRMGAVVRGPRDGVKISPEVIAAEEAYAVHFVTDNPEENRFRSSYPIPCLALLR